MLEDIISSKGRRKLLVGLFAGLTLGYPTGFIVGTSLTKQFSENKQLSARDTDQKTSSPLLPSKNLNSATVIK